MTTLFVLLIVYQFKHFLADFPLQGSYMLGKFKPGWEFVGPLLAHTGVHAAFTFVIALFVKPELALPLALFDLVIHFTMDRIKASPKMLGRFKALSGREYMQLVKQNEMPGEAMYTCTKEEKMAILKANTYFWWALGLDQMVHHLTHYAIIYMLVTS